MKNILLVIYIFCGAVFLNIQGSMMAESLAAEKEHPIVPCAHPMFRTLDFWAGDWLVYHRESGTLAGFDRVSRTLNGCAIQQAWVSLDDYFSSPLVPFRMNGKSLTAFNGEQWVQYWVDNQAGSQITKGKFDGNMLVMTSETPIMGHIYKLTWEPQKDGTINHIARRKKIDEEEWQLLFDFIYRRNSSHIPLPDGGASDGAASSEDEDQK